MKIFIGMETSGQVRRRVALMGHEVISCDLLPATDDQPIIGTHLVGDVFEILERLRLGGWWPDAALFHPDCTYLTVAAEWAYKDPDFARYPGVGYHQKLRPETLFGADRRAARLAAIRDWERIDALPISRKIAENPAKGALSKGFRPPDQCVHPYMLGDDASKETGLWLWNVKAIDIDPGKRVSGRLVPREKAMGKSDRANGNRGPAFIERWSNQTDTGQNRLSPGPDRWQKRSETFPGIADALAKALVDG
jgi:hypothetical protein